MRVTVAAVYTVALMCFPSPILMGEGLEADSPDRLPKSWSIPEVRILAFD
jgi:hypothetical protein